MEDPTDDERADELAATDELDATGTAELLEVDAAADELDATGAAELLDAADELDATGTAELLEVEDGTPALPVDDDDNPPVTPLLYT